MRILNTSLALLAAGAFGFAACGEDTSTANDGNELTDVRIDLGDDRFLVDPFVLPGDLQPWQPGGGGNSEPVGGWCESRELGAVQACRMCEVRSTACLEACDFGAIGDPDPDPVAVENCVSGHCGGCARAGTEACEDAQRLCAECGVCSRLDQDVEAVEPDEMCLALWAACDADCGLTGGATCALCTVRVTTECGER